MLKFRTGLIFAVLLLSGCDHKKQNQAQAEAGNATVAQNDSDLTGQPPATTNSVVTPSAPPAKPTAKTDSNGAISGDQAQPPPTAVAATAPSSDNSSSTLTLTNSPSSTSDGDAPRLAMNTPNPVAATNPAPSSDNAPAQSQDQNQVAVIETSFGRIVIELDDYAAPKTCQNFRKLVSEGFYNHTTFHRVIPNFIIQGGDPNSRSDNRESYGKGDPGYTLPAEIKLKHDLGAVAMARLPDSVNPRRESNGSQFYICIAACPSLDDQYTVFGHVILGMDVAHVIASQPRDQRDNPLGRIPMEVRLEPRDQAESEGSAGNP